MKKTVCSIVALMMSVTLLTLSATAASADELSVEAYQQIILEGVNQHRQSLGLAPLQINTFISEQALKHSRNMASHNIELGHQDFSQRIRYIYQHTTAPRGGAENVARYQLPPEQVVQQWLASPGHRKNIEGDFNLTGIGVVRNEAGEVYYTQIFVKADGVNQVS